ncbi:MAG: hypothetical protein A2V70_11780 [Planctomycetes bacterium RBG_13_63_9]|nr:MAG: hypothetical protein A2V70_11780 [Planctomycetes bacterium RBG_13_63_9]
MADSGWIPSGGFLLPSGRFVVVDEDMLAYLRFEAERRGISVEEVYDEEAQFGAIAQRNALTTEELKTLARISEPDARLLEGDEECPF